MSHVWRPSHHRRCASSEDRRSAERRRRGIVGVQPLLWKPANERLGAVETAVLHAAGEEVGPLVSGSVAAPYVQEGGFWEWNVTIGMDEKTLLKRVGFFFAST